MMWFFTQRHVPKHFFHINTSADVTYRVMSHFTEQRKWSNMIGQRMEFFLEVLKDKNITIPDNKLLSIVLLKICEKRFFQKYNFRSSHHSKETYANCKCTLSKF